MTDRIAAEAFFERLDAAAGTAIDPYVTFSAYVKAIGDRWLRVSRGGIITSASLRRATDWDALLIRFGHNGLRRHGLGHTGATWLANAGVPLDVIARILGHTSLETTRTYHHIDDRQLAEAADTVNQHLRQHAEEEFHH